MLHEMRNIQETRRAACNTGNKDLHRSPISCYVMPGYSMPVAVQASDSKMAQVKKLITQFNAGERERLLKSLEEL